jgi:UDP-glucuronate decarboxylase
MRCDDGRVISNVICQALAGDDITIYGDGSQSRSFCFIDDMIDALTGLMHSEQAAGIPVNLGNPDEWTVNRLADLIVAMTGSRSRIIHHPLPVDDPKRRRPDITRANALLGWQPVTDLRRGLGETIKWFEEEHNRVALPLYAGAAIAVAAE